LTVLGSDAAVELDRAGGGMTGYWVLIVDDSDDDAVLVAEALRESGIEFAYERVDTEPALRSALAARTPDVVISDYRLPGFSAEQALQLLRDSGHDTPFILTSGKIGEEAAVAMMRSGAQDFVRKDLLHRLAPAVRRELADADVRRQRRAAEEALRDSESRYRLLADHAQDVIYHGTLSPVAALDYLSPAVAAVTGYPASELLGPVSRLSVHIVDPADRARFEESLRSPTSTPLVVVWHRPDGSVAWLEQRAQAILDEDGRPVAVEGVLRDITERIIAERERELLIGQLGQIERIEALGLLAGGVAHDFNNALAVILSCAALLKDDLDPSHPGHADVDRIRRSAERSATLTRQLLIFARDEPAQADAVDITATIRGVEDLIRRTIGEDIEFVCHLAAGPHAVTIDASKIEQVILNLAINSRAAMPGGGRLSVQVEASTVTADSPENPEVPAGSYVHISVADTGTGMAPGVAKRVFDPFFTTKAPGHGTGLGMATAYAVITQAGGHINLHTELGRGTTVHIYLPPVEGLPNEREPAADSPINGNAETILVVEDEELLRDVISRILTRHQYQILVAESGVEALAIDARPGVRVDALLTDVIMPGMSGVELVERLRADRPDHLPVLYMSGYTASQLPPDGTEGVRTHFIPKPFDAQTLLVALRDAIDDRHGPPLLPPELPAANPAAA
jgi:PAS domain S-box-containing protein